MKFGKIRVRVMSALASGALLASGAAVAQQAGAPPAQQQVEIAPVSDTELKAFVAANRKVVEVANDMTVKLQEAPDQDSANTIQADAEQKMTARIEEEGLTADRYTEIALLAQSDPAFLAKLQEAASGG